MQRGKVGGPYLALGKEETLLTLSPVLALETQIYPFRPPFSRLTPGKRQGLPLLTSRLNWMHEPVHLDIPVFHIGTGLAQLSLGSLGGQSQWEWVRDTLQDRVSSLFQVHRHLSI